MLTDVLKSTFRGFKANGKYHQIRKTLMQDKKYTLTRYLDLNNPRSSRKDFYSNAIVEKFSEFYKRKHKAK